MTDPTANQRLQSVVLDESSLASVSRDQEHERQVAIFDLLEANVFAPANAPGGPTTDHRLDRQPPGLDISGPGYAQRHLLSLSPFRSVIKDYFMICESYYDAIRNSTPAQIEALDMGRRGSTTRARNCCGRAWRARSPSTSTPPGVSSP